MAYIVCPIHKTLVFPLRYNKVIKGKTNSINIGWFYCEGCKKPIKIKIVIEDERKKK